MEIVSDLEQARNAVASIRSEVSRHRFESARAKVTATAEKLSTCSGRISQETADFLSTSVGDPDISGNKVAEIWSSHLRELERVRALRPHLQTVAFVAGSVARSGAAVWAENLRTQPVTGVEDPWTPNDWRDAWNWACTDAHLRAIDGRARLLELDEQRRAAEEEKRKLFHDVVRMRTLLKLHFVAQQFAQSWFLREQPLDGTHRVSNCRGSTVESLRDGARRKPGVLAAEIESCRTGEPELLGVIVDVQRGGTEDQVVETHPKDLGSRPLDRIDDRLGMMVNGRRSFITHPGRFVASNLLPADAHC
jgi:hypothetical protein